MKLFSTVVFSIYLGLSPVYWWPGVSAGLLETIKFGLVGAGIVSVWADAILERKLEIAKGLLGPGGFFALLVAGGWGFAQADLGVSLIRLKDIFLGFVMLWTFFIYQRLDVNLERIFSTASLFVSAHCFLVISSKMFGFPRWSGPSEFVAPELWTSGFGGASTGWSNGTALFVPILAGGLVRNANSSGSLKLMLCLTIIFIMGSQLVVGGRGGLLASWVGLGLIFFSRGNKKWLLVFGSVALVVILCMPDFLEKQLQTERLKSENPDIEEIDSFSAGRVLTNLRALQIAAERPFTGYGFGTITFEGHDIHNLWLKMMVEGGFLFPLMFLAIVIQLLRGTFLNKSPPGNSNQEDANHYRAVTEIKSWGVVIICGLVISMFEPNVILGVFQNSAVWWAAAGAGISAQRLIQKKA